MSTSTASHIPARTRPELIASLRHNLQLGEAELEELRAELRDRAATKDDLSELAWRARHLGSEQCRLDLIEQGQLIADGEGAWDVVWYGVDAVLAYGVNPPTAIGQTRLQADLAFLANLAEHDVDYAVTGELPAHMTYDPGLVEANAIRNRPAPRPQDV